MKTMKPISWVAAIAMATALMGVTLVATPTIMGVETSATSQMGPGGPHGRRGGPGGPGGHWRMLRALDLSDEQRQELRASMEEVRGQMREVHENLFAAKKSLHEAVLRGDDESILRELAEAVGDAEGEVAFVRAQQFARIVTILDDEQKLKMQQLYEEAESRREGRKERF